MSAFEANLGPVLDNLRTYHGQAIVHTAAGGESGTSITAIVGQAESWVEEAEDGRIEMSECVVTIDGNQVTVVKGDTLTFDGKDWIVDRTTDKPGGQVECIVRRRRALERSSPGYRRRY